MSDSISNDCLVHYNSQHIQVRRDFFDLCAYDKSLYNTRKNEKGNVIKDEPNQECMAKILRIIETLTNSAREAWLIKAMNAKKNGFKVPQEPKEHRIPLAYPAICTLLYNTYGASTVRNSIAVLIQRGYITRYQDSINSIPEYVLCIKVVQDALFQQAQAQYNNRLLNSTPTFQKKERPKKEKSAVENNSPGVQIQQPPPLNSTAQGSKFNSNKRRSEKIDNNTDKREGSKTEKPVQPTSPTKPSPLSLDEQNLISGFTKLVEKHTDWKHYAVHLPQKSHADYRLFQEIAARCPSEQEMEQVFLAFWNQQDRDTKYFWRDPNKLKLNTYCRHYDAMRNTAIPPKANERREKAATQGMTYDTAANLVKEILETTQAHGYAVQAETTEDNELWAVRVLWGERTITVESVSRWREVFETMQEIILEESQQLQLA